MCLYVWGGGGGQSSSVLHRRALLRVLHCPLAFFHTQPVGRILNRFSQVQRLAAPTAAVIAVVVVVVVAAAVIAGLVVVVAEGSIR